MEILKRLVAEASKSIPQFNENLLTEYRLKKTYEARHYLDEIFRDCNRLFPEIKYIGYKVLSPEERLHYLTNRLIPRNSFSIQVTSSELIRYEFRFKGDPYYLHADLPYFRTPYSGVTINDFPYYHVLPLMEKGCMNVKDDDVIVKVLRAPLTFSRREKTKPTGRTYQTVEGGVIREHLLTTKIHQKAASAKQKPTPLLVYPLARNGWFQTIKEYGIEDLDFVDTVVPHKDYIHVELNRTSSLRIRCSELGNLMYRRFVISVISIAKDTRYRTFTAKDLKNKTFYQAALGSYTYSAPQVALSVRHAQEHLEMNETLLDPSASRFLSQIGIKVNSLYDLLREIFFRIDQCVVQYQVANLYDKRIACDQLTAGAIRNMFTEQFKILNNSGYKKKGLQPDLVRRLMRSISGTSWIAASPVFKSAAFYNDNWLLTIGAKKVRSQDSGDPKSDKKAPRLPLEECTAHPSHLVVESVLAISSNNPIASGDINPYLQIDDFGNVVVPEYAKSVENVFK